MRMLGIVAALLSTAVAAQDQPDPVEIFRAAAERLEQADAFSVHIEKVFDVILVDGMKVQYSGAADVVHSRRDGLFIDYGDDLSAKRFWFDGKAVTLLDELANIYVSVPFEGPVDEVIDGIEERHGVRLPLGGIFNRSLYREFEERVVTARHLGIHDVDGRACDHLLFRGESEDWQIWIDADNGNLLCKSVVNFRDIEGSPQQAIVFSDWDFAPAVDAFTFRAELPDGALRTEFVQPAGE